jgi:lysozyme
MIPTSVSQTGIDLIKKFEGLHKVGDDGLIHSYRCVAGKWTIGYGSCKGVRSGMKITPAEAEQLLIDDIESHAKAIHRFVHVPLSQNQYDSLTSWIFNIGEGNFKSSTLLKKLNKGLYDEIPEQLNRWNKARVDGKLTPLRGLTRRRAAEGALFSMDAILASDGGDLMTQKPTQEAPKSLAKSKTMAGAGIAGAATGLNEVAGQIQGLVAYAPMLKTVFLLCAIGGIALAAYARWKDNKEGIH